MDTCVWCAYTCYRPKRNSDSSRHGGAPAPCPHQHQAPSRCSPRVPQPPPPAPGSHSPLPGSPTPVLEPHHVPPQGAGLRPGDRAKHLQRQTGNQTRSSDSITHEVNHHTVNQTRSSDFITHEVNHHTVLQHVELYLKQHTPLSTLVCTGLVDRLEWLVASG